MTAGDPMLESLQALAPDLARMDAPDVSGKLAPYLDHLRQPLPAEHAKAAVDAVSAVARALYAQGRSAEALPLARELLARCLQGSDSVQTRRAAGVCGLLAADSGDLVGAIEYHVRSLRLAAGDEDRLEMARTWTNIGHAIGVAGRHEMAARCFERCLALIEPMAAASQVRYPALVNLSDAYFHLGRAEEGVRHGEEALAELTLLAGADPYSAILLRRNLVRLLLASGRTEAASQHVQAAVALAESAPSPRAAIAVDITRSAYEVATGRADLALTRLDRLLARAREVPATLHEALASAARAEEAAGNAARALMRLDELTQHVYGNAIDRARRVIGVAGIDTAESTAEHEREQARSRLVSMLDPPAPPPAWAALRRLAAGAALRMDDTGWHGVRVGALVKALALAAGTPPLQALELGLASELHDVGLTSIPAAVLGKRGLLNEAERSVVGRHAEAGAAMLLEDNHPRMLLARDIARYHHARWDGAGYPARVAGRSIPLGARMCAIADAYDAMVCGLAGRPPVSLGRALQELRAQAGKQFDPELVTCFDALVNDELDGLGLDPAAAPGMEAFQELVLSLKENRGFV